MSTKVKGDKIKEGSIPLSALATEVKAKIENAGGGADWNAKEGDAGYIENRPFRIIKSNNCEITNINSYFTINEDEYYPNNDLFIKYNNKIALLAKEKEVLYYDDGKYLDLDDVQFYIGNDDESNISINSEVDFDLIIALSSEFIPNTVLKTTPQTLTDADKNQALANLGIDPVVWKYMCNPIFLINDNSNIPDELLDDDGNFKYDIPNMYRIIVGDAGNNQVLIPYVIEDMCCMATMLYTYKDGDNVQISNASVAAYMYNGKVVVEW